MLTLDWFHNWLAYYWQAYSDVFLLLVVIVFLLIALTVLLKSGRQSQLDSERLKEYMAAKYPPMTPEQEAAGHQAVRRWEREQYLKEGGHK